MTKAVAIYLIIATAFVALLLQPFQKPSKPGGHRNVRLSRRLGGSGLWTLHFDPLVAKMEQNAELKRIIKMENNENDKNKSGNKNGEVVEVLDAEIGEEDGVYFGEDGKLNLTLRLTILFPLIDRMPKDGYVGLKELENWNIMQAHERMHHRTRRGLDQNDKNEDGLISFSEYLPHFSEEDIKKNNRSRGGAGWWMEQFKNADVDQDGQLNFEELQDFLHPEDSKNKKVQEWLLYDRIRRMDRDNDGMLSFEEFRDNAYGTFKAYYGFVSGENNVPLSLVQFSNLDVNKDGLEFKKLALGLGIVLIHFGYPELLSTEELKFVRQYLFPGELDYARFITTYLLKEVDDNHDGRLSLDEILRHENKFYHSIYIGDDEDEDEDEDYVHIHDEF